MRAILLLLTLAWALPALAFCGFYVGSADEPLHNSATQVVLMREGDRTALSMQNDYRGPPKDFALVVPVPVVVQKADVKTLPRAVFSRVDRLAAPRLVEYWEQDPCPQHGLEGAGMGSAGIGGLGTSGFGRGGGGTSRPRVRVEAKFSVGEYQIVVLGADDSAALDAWLRQNGYNIPAGAEAALRPYVAGGMKFFVAKVDPQKVAFEDGRALLSPLRVTYRSKDLRLPVRLGLLNAGDAQDLVVHVLARDSRYEVANYPNTTIPTNLDLTPDMRARFPQFYAALFDATLRAHPGAVVTEYAWQATKCDPCPGPVLSALDLATLGADVLLPEGVSAGRSGVLLRQTSTSVKGSLHEGIVRRIARRHGSRMRYCAEVSQAGAPPGPKATIQARFQIDPKGRVSSKPNVTITGLAHKTAACVARTIRRWRFPESQDGKPIEVKLGWRASPGPARGLRGRNRPLNRFVLTRLHYRYGKQALGEDLVFRPAQAIVGGREVRRPRPAPKPAKRAPAKKKAKKRGHDLLKGNKLSPETVATLNAAFGQAGGLGGMGGFGLRRLSNHDGVLETGASPGRFNSFQGRYAIRHAWTGAVACKNPTRGIWGGPPEGGSKPTTSAAGPPPTRAAFDLAEAVPAGIPDLKVPAKQTAK